jgi:glutamate---cysteine ligase / carboxylate-amine ligase
MVPIVAVTPPSFTIGVEEEYLLVDRETRNLVVDPNPDLWAKAENRLGSAVMPELLKAQIEIATRPHSDTATLTADLLSLRRTVAATADEFGAAIIAASTHPFALWWEQKHTDQDRYLMLAQDLAMVGQRMVICGMHVHVAIEDPELRIDLMNQVAYFLPHLLALTTSSPFWGGRNTGLKSYRLNVFRTLPRTGLPENFDSWAEYQRHVDVLVNAELIQDASKIWWDIRPSSKYPTLEMRVCDICTSAEDAIAVASLYRCLLHMLYRLRRENQRWRRYSNMLIAENLWRAQRYGVEGSLMDFGESVLVPFADLADELAYLVQPDAEILGCVDEVEHIRTIARRGTSAKRQIAAYNAATEAGSSTQEALESVVDELISETTRGLDTP